MSSFGKLSGAVPVNQPTCLAARAPSVRPRFPSSLQDIEGFPCYHGLEVCAGSLARSAPRVMDCKSTFTRMDWTFTNRAAPPSSVKLWSIQAGLCNQPCIWDVAGNLAIKNELSQSSSNVAAALEPVRCSSHWSELRHSPPELRS